MCRVFGFTATPIKNKCINMYESDKSYSVIYKYDFSQALADSRVCNYSINIPFYTLNDDELIEHAQMRKLLEYCAEHNRKRVILYTRFTNKQSELTTTASMFAQFP